jgi:hypothetical protein
MGSDRSCDVDYNATAGAPQLAALRMQARRFTAKIPSSPPKASPNSPNSEQIMNHENKNIKEAGMLVLRVWREAASFFLSIELGLMVLVAFATVGGVWLAAMGDARSLLAFGFAIAYVAGRAVLHVKRVLAWPFI